MRRADRLFLIIHALRGRRTATLARDLASTLGVSLRTIYRDVADLQLSGVPIEGEAGVGYMSAQGFGHPAAHVQRRRTRSASRRHALRARVRGHAARFRRASGVAEDRSRAAAGVAREMPIVRASSRPASSDRIEATGIIDRLHAAVIDHLVLRMTYRDEAGSGTEREIEPLCLAFWGGAWTLGAWCRLRHGFRSFRPDRIAAFDPHRRNFRRNAAARTRCLSATCKRRLIVTS